MKSNRNLLLISVFLVSLMLTSSISTILLHRIPHVQDSVVYLFQAKILSKRALYVYPPLPLTFFGYQFVYSGRDKTYGIFPPGWPLVLSFGVLSGAPWLVNPVISSICLLLLYFVGRELYDERTAILAVILGLLSPFMMFMGATYLSHPLTLMFILIFMYFSIRTLREDRHLHPLNAGLYLGLAFITRPLTSFAIAFPILFFVSFHLKKGRTTKILVLLLGFLTFFSVQLSYNYLLTGNPMYFPQNKYFDAFVRPGCNSLGFGENVGCEPMWGSYGHTPAKALKNTKLNLTVLSRDLFGWPITSFLFLLALLLLPAKNRWDYLLTGCILSVLIAYFFYYRDGVTFGARFLYETMPMFLLLTARGIKRAESLLAKTTGRLSPMLTFAFIALLFLFSALSYIPDRIDEYGDDYWGSYSLVYSDVYDDLSRINGARTVVFVAQKYYGSAFILTSPDLSDSILFVRDHGQNIDSKFHELFFPEFNCLIYTEEKSIIHC